MFLQFKEKGLRNNEIIEIINVKRATFYRWLNAFNKDGPRGLEPRSRKPRTLRNTQWDLVLVKRILELRAAYPMWGKAKLHCLLLSEGFEASQSTVGRILSKMMRKGRILSTRALRKRCPVFYKKRKVHRTHAVRLPKGKKAALPGELVQVDSMTLNLFSGFRIKQFTAYCPISRISVVDVYRKATAFNASRFLENLLLEMPFEIKGIQVDGGSEFMKDFESLCAEKKIALYVLPPRSPKLNGGVERANGSWRYEFYWSNHLLLNLEGLRKQVKEFQHVYNYIRPHQALNYKTPMAYLDIWNRQERSVLSHMY